MSSGGADKARRISMIEERYREAERAIINDYLRPDGQREPEFSCGTDHLVENFQSIDLAREQLLDAATRVFEYAEQELREDDEDEDEDERRARLEQAVMSLGQQMREAEASCALDRDPLGGTRSAEPAEKE